MPLEFQRGAQLAAGHGKVHWHEAPLLDPLRIGGGAGVDPGSRSSHFEFRTKNFKNQDLPVYGPLDRPRDRGVGDGLLDRLGLAPDLLAPVDGGGGELVGGLQGVRVHVHLEGEEAAEELPPVADEHGVAETGQLLHDAVLDQHGGDVLAPGRDDELLDPVSDIYKFEFPANFYITKFEFYLPVIFR